MTVRLGSASLIVSISDAEGFVVRHGSNPDIILASKSADQCTEDDWDTLWSLFDNDLRLARQR